MKTPVFLIATALTVSAFYSLEPACRQSSADSEYHVKCIPLLAEQLDINANTVYAPAFRAAWTLLATNIIGEPVKMVNPILLAGELNQHPYRPENLSDWVLEAGNVEDGVIERIRQSLMYSFSETAPELDKWRKEKDAVICYARLVRVMTFKYPFESLDWNFFNGKKMERVSCFGITKKRFNEDKDIAAMQQQVRIFDYRHPDDFIVTLSTADPDAEIILAKIPPQNSLKEMVAAVSERIERSFPEEFSNIDEIMIPKIHLESEKRFEELIHQHLANKGFEEWFFAEARQSVNFSLNESGALATATGEIVKIKGPTSRIYAFDKPFLVICKNRNSTEPELVAWIANTDVMQISH